MDFTLAIFILVYLAMAVGHLPGFRVDRTGAAAVGAMVLIAWGQISPAAAWDAVDYRSIGLLFGLMVISSAFTVAEECHKRGIALSFGEFAKAGLPTSIICLAMAGAWISHLG